MNSELPAMRRVRVAVLMGGQSSERAVSLATGRMVLEALDPLKYEATAIDTLDLTALSVCSPARLSASDAEESPHQAAGVTPESGPSGRLVSSGGAGRLEHPGAFACGALSGPPDIVFIALHGRGGEDGAVQGMLEVLGLPYTGSGVLASALAMDKAMSKRLFRAEGIPVIEDVQIRRSERLTGEELLHRVREALTDFPVFVKPNAEGSTVGASLVTGPEQLSAAVASALRYDELALVERYVSGVEITVGVLEEARGPEGLLALPVMEIVPRGRFYDYESKYAAGGSEHIVPARISVALQERARQIACQCHRLLGCRSMSRTDLIAVGDRLYVLELNTIPGMTPTSLLPQAAAYAGISFPALLDRLIASALCGPA